MFMTMLLCSEPLSPTALPLCFYNVRANQISAHVCVCVFDCASMCHHCTSRCVCLPMRVCLCVCEWELFF